MSRACQCLDVRSLMFVYALMHQRQYIGVNPLGRTRMPFVTAWGGSLAEINLEQGSLNGRSKVRHWGLIRSGCKTPALRCSAATSRGQQRDFADAVLSAAHLAYIRTIHQPTQVSKSCRIKKGPERAASGPSMLIRIAGKRDPSRISASWLHPGSTPQTRLR